MTRFTNALRQWWRMEWGWSRFPLTVRLGSPRHWTRFRLRWDDDRPIQWVSVERGCAGCDPAWAITLDWSDHARTLDDKRRGRDTPND